MDMNYSENKDVQEEVTLPGFRFYPTDEELVGFYLKRKVEKKYTNMELIKQMDIYKFDPWDLTKACSLVEKEWYFYCKRGRKYRNSVRPNRVTGSGFWKATGIDKPIYTPSSSNQGGDHLFGGCIGLKKSLVYYRGNAGKGTKTDWMMHEFRLPDQPNPKTNTLEAEVWTLCRIFKRNASCRKYTSNWREISNSKRHDLKTEVSSKSCSVESEIQEGNYINFGFDQPSAVSKPNIVDHGRVVSNNDNNSNQFATKKQLVSESRPMASSSSMFSQMDVKNYNDDFFFAMNDNNWDELSHILGGFSSYSSPL